jgi:hypothetical protein
VNYDSMSDFEINKLVAEGRPFTQVVGDGSYPSASEDAVHVITKTFKYGNETEGAFDPCNNPADAWPIINEIWSTLMSITFYDYKIGLGVSQTTIWDARAHMHGGGKLRAAMIVYLMMKEGE